MNITVVGMGYTGVPIAALLANVPGNHVTGIQRKSNRSGWKINSINEGKSPFLYNEPGLQKLISKVIKNEKFIVTEKTDSYETSDVILVNIQVPIDQKKHPLNHNLLSVIKQISEKINSGTLLSLESTLAPGTTTNLILPILEEKSKMNAGNDFHIVYSYERVTPGRLLYNIQYLPKIIGGLTTKCIDKAVNLYSKIVKAELYLTDILTAEFSKVVENAYRDVNIAFANEIALISESLGTNFYEVRKIVNNLPNIPANPLKNPFRNLHLPGPGVGGYCLPKDTWLLKYGLDTYGKNKVKTNVITNCREKNDSMPNHMKNLIINKLKKQSIQIENSKIAILGYAYLENCGDTRNTPTKELVRLLVNEQIHSIKIHDPYVKNQVKFLTNDLRSTLKDSNCMAILTGHKQYYEIDLKWLKTIMDTPIIIDGRNVFNQEICEKEGFIYQGIGIGQK